MKKLLGFVFLCIPLYAWGDNLIFNPGFDMTPWDTSWTKDFCTISDTVAPDSSNLHSAPRCCRISSWTYPGIDSGYAIISQEVGKVINCTCRVYYWHSLYASADNWAYCGAHILCKVNDQDYFDRWPGEWAETLKVTDNTEYQVLLEWKKWEKVFGPSDTVKGIAFCTDQRTDTLDGTASVSFYVDDVYISGEKIGVEEDSRLQVADSRVEISPNPFIQSTTIKYHLPIKSKISLEIYDITGRRVKTLVNEEKEAGNYNISFDAKDLTAGIYFAKLVVDGVKKTKKLTILR